jgi:hypothetical protein
MKRIVNNWTYALAIVGLIAGGCAANNYRNVDSAFARNDKPHDFNFTAPGAENFQELWVIERGSKVTNASPNALFLSPEPSSLRALVHGRERPMPLRHMNVNATINGYIGTVDVTQQFENPYAQKIEAVYVFTLPEDAAVDDFIMTIGKRRIRGIIRERKVAEAIYAQAGHLGYLASLLSADQTNTFRQTIANIEPGINIDVDIHYFQALHFEDGWYEFMFPTACNSKGNSKEQSVPISLSVDVNAGVTIADLECLDHVIVKKFIAPEHLTVQLSPDDGIPNDDFKLRYRLTTGKPPADLITYRDERGGYFTLLLHPPNDSPLTNVKIDWGAMQVSEVYSGRFTDLPSGHAVMVAGRFSGTEPTSVTVTGTAGNQPVSFSIPADLAKTSSEKTIPKIWASMKIAKLERDWFGLDIFEYIRNIKQVALDYGLASPFTAFLAVDASEPTEDSKMIPVPAVP